MKRSVKEQKAAESDAAAERARRYKLLEALGEELERPANSVTALYTDLLGCALYEVLKAKGDAAKDDAAESFACMVAYCYVRRHQLSDRTHNFVVNMDDYACKGRKPSPAQLEYLAGVYERLKREAKG